MLFLGHGERLCEAVLVGIDETAGQQQFPPEPAQFPKGLHHRGAGRVDTTLPGR